MKQESKNIDLMGGERFQEAIRLIDEANSADPNFIASAEGKRPKELVHSEMVTRWVERLAPEADEPLLLAARAHHIRRWEIPRSSYPIGRRGYLRWRTALQQFHSVEAGAILERCGYDVDTSTRVQELIRKHKLGRDPAAQTLEDALCLVFLETQFADVARTLAHETLGGVVRKTWEKMSERGRSLAVELPIAPADRDLLISLLNQSGPSDQPAPD